MQTSPILTHRAAQLHQRDLRAEAAHSRLVAQTRSTTSPSRRKEISLPTLIAVRSFVHSLRVSPRAA